MEKIVIEEKQSKTVMLALMGVMMTALSALILVTGVYAREVLFDVVGVIGTAFFGVCTVYIFSRVIKSKALLTITFDGIEDSSSAAAIGFIPFEEIKQFQSVNVYGQKMIGVELRDTETFLKKLTPMRQRAAKANMKLGTPPINIRVDTAKDMNIEDIMSLLQKRLSDYNSLYK